MKYDNDKLKFIKPVFITNTKITIGKTDHKKGMLWNNKRNGTSNYQGQRNNNSNSFKFNAATKLLNPLNQVAVKFMVQTYY